MKKTLMVLSFALCATLAFAQAQRTPAAKMQQVSTAEVVKANDNASYKASIFTKEETPIRTWDFSAANQGYSIHNVGAGEVVNGRLLTPHSQNATHAQWQRFSGTSAADMAEWGNSYPVSISSNDANFRNNYGFGWFEYYLDACSSNNGFMFMSMQDQIAGWGGTGATGVFHSAIVLEPISTEGIPVIGLRLFQYFRKFNRDSCFIDYSVDGNTWNAIGINLRDVDVAVNSSLLGTYEYTLPATATGNQTTLYLRIRWNANEIAGGAYGYFWALDDVAAMPGKNSNLKQYGETYLAGGYHFMPQGLNLPISWNTDILNNGAITQTGIEAQLYAINNGTATMYANQTIANLASGATVTVNIDDAGFNSEDMPNWPSQPVANPRSIPTTTLGENYVTATIVTDSLTAAYDTILYTVTGADNGDHVWALDNGVITRHREQLFHNSIHDNTIGDDGEFYTAGYSVSLRYKVGPEVPAGWVIRGMEMVASNYSDGDAIYPSRPGTMIMPTLTWDSIAGESIWFKRVDHGADIHTVTANELNDTATIGTDAGMFLTYGNYNTVRIDFPNQPELTPNREFRVGYELAQNGNFGVATVTNAYTYINQENDEEEVMLFRRDSLNGMKKYANTFGRPTYADIRYEDPVSGDGTWGSFSDVPMIRMIVGPRVDRPVYTTAIECENLNGAEGTVYVTSGSLCGTNYSINEGAKVTFYIEFNEGDQLKQLLIDGVAVEPYDEYDGTGDENFIMGTYETEDGQEGIYYTYTLRNVTANHTLKAVFDEEAVNTVEESVNMKLVPNPATSQVKLSIAGVEGMVNFSLVDMSGRVIMNKQVNAENMQTIDLSNVAKGAYFVRVTNNNFSKVEKLIVR